MTCEEFSNEFDILYNNIMSNQAPGLDEYEKSVFLTRAQDDIVKRYFTPKGNKDFEGFDSSLKRNMDFSSLYRNYTIYAEKVALSKLDIDDVKSNYLAAVQFIKTKAKSIRGLIDNLNEGISSYFIDPENTQKCWYGVCSKDLAVYLENDSGIVFVNKRNAGSSFPYKSSDSDDWLIRCSQNSDEIIADIDTVFNEPSEALYAIKDSVADNIKDVINISLSFSQGNDPVFLPINDQLLVEDTVLKKDRLLQILPITSAEYIRLMSKPFKQPLKNQAWKLQEQSTDTSLSYKLFFGKNNNFKEYTLRYLTHPKPIILTNLGNEGLSINGYVGANEDNQLVKDGATTGYTCQLNSELHYEILQRAVELAKAAYTGDLSSTIQIGNVSSTNVGLGIDPQQVQRTR
jgi:hypothetical protein